jgi:hypothetical protein
MGKMTVIVDQSATKRMCRTTPSNWQNRSARFVKLENIHMPNVSLPSAGCAFSESATTKARSGKKISSAATEKDKRSAW